MSGEDLDSDSSGAILARTRQTMGVGQRDVAEALHLSEQVVDALERGDKMQLPSYVFTRGYVRAYAKLLDLEADPIVKLLTAEYGATADIENAPVGVITDDDAAMAGTYVGGGLGDSRRKLPIEVILFIAIALIIVVGILVWMIVPDQAEGAQDPDDGRSPGGDSTQSLSAAETSATTTPNLRFGNEYQQEVNRGGEIIADRGAPTLSSENLSTDSPRVVDDEAGVDVANVASTSTDENLSLPAVETDSSVRRLTATGNQRLSFTFSEDCWLEIKSSSGRVLVGEVGKLGTTLEFIGQGPFGVQLGYAPGVVLRFNDEPVALTQFTRNNVASLVIGH